jgi:hypothetical protein
VAKNNKYEGTTVSLEIENRNFDNIVFQPSKPVLDSELNFISDIQSAKLQDAVRSKIPSGWLDANYSLGFDENSDNFGINTTNEPNVLYLNSQKSVPSLAAVNGWVLQIGGTDLTEDNKVKVTLSNPPSSGSRTDLVFLEVWKALVQHDSTVNKPSVDKVFKYGNTQYGGDNLDDEILNTAINLETTKRVQIQYRIRVVSGVDFSGTPEGVDDTVTVLAQGTQASPVATYSFTNAGESLDDYGLYVAGDGSQQSCDDLGTIDGYVYAIPMLKIHRRNKGNFSNANQNGSSVTILSGDESDRPDGLFQDQVHIYDIEDLRHAVSFEGFNYQELLDKTVDDLYSGQLKTSLSKSLLDGNLQRTNLGLYVNKISNTTEANTDLITKPNSQQRYFSDVAASVKSTEKRTINDKTVGSNGTDWISTDEIQVDVNTFFGAATAVIGSFTPIVKFSETDQGPFTTVNGTWADLGTDTATFTLGVNGSLTDQDIFITYELDYNAIGDRLTQPITDMVLIEDNKRNEEWGFISVNDLDESVTSNQRRRERNVALREEVSGFPDFAFVYRLNTSFNNYGIGTLYSYYVQATGATLSYTIPESLINTNDTAYVYAIYNVDTASFITPTSVQKNIDGSLNVTLPSAVSNLLRFDVALKGGVVEYDERTQSIVDMGRVEFYEIMGNGTDEIVLKNSTVDDDPNDLIIGVQREYRETSPTIFESVPACYVNNIRQFPDVTLEPDSSLIKLKFSFNIPITQKITIALLLNHTLDSTENLNLYYDYYSYKGVTSKDNFGTDCDAFINSKIMYHRNKLDVVTNGTGEVNTAEALPKKYEPLIPKLPKVDSAVDGLFTGTVHRSKEIVGGSYTIDSDYNSPYASGKSNTFNKDGVSQVKGTNVGGLFVSAAEDGEAGVHKLMVSSLVEMVEEDGSKNFLPGELSLKIETNYIDNDSVSRITNSDSGEANNSFDMFKIEGRPLIKLNSK